MRFLNIHGVGSRRVFAPNVDSMALAQADLKSAVSFDRPNRAERIRPGPHQRRLTSFLEHRASRKQRDAYNNQSKRDLFVHDADAAQVTLHFQERIAAASLLTRTRA